MQKVIESLQEQVKKALDGRSQRWLCFKVQISESDFSKKVRGKLMKFTQEEIDAINAVLKSNIKLQ